MSVRHGIARGRVSCPVSCKVVADRVGRVVEELCQSRGWVGAKV
jgi:hypothetical protein